MALEQDLQRTVNGRVLLAGDEGFDAARRPWNVAVDQPVLAVVEAADAADVAKVVRYARSAGLAISTQPSGHGATGNADGVILLRTARLDELVVDPAARRARVGAGVAWGRVLAETGPHGLIGLAGSSPVVTVTGYTLGGGLSWFSRRHGRAAESVRAFDIVDADGVPRNVTAESDPELFWALRGGGGDFAIVTALEFDLHPAPVLYGGRMLWPGERAEEVLAAFRESVRETPEEMTMWYELVQVPDFPSVPEPIRGRSVVIVDSTHLGEPLHGESLLRRFDKIDGRILDSRGTLPVAELGSITAEPTDPSAGIGRAELLTNLDDAAAGTLLSAALGDTGSVAPLITVQVRQLGGALAQAPETAGPGADITEPYLVYMFGAPITPEIGTAVRERQAALAAALAPHSSGRKPFTVLRPEERVADAVNAADLARLRDIKARRDPQGTFRSNFPVAR